MFIHRCWITFKKYHIVGGFGFWFLLIILYRAPWYYYVSTTITLFIEIAIIYCAPFITWAMDLKWAAGETFWSEYSVVIALRWTVVIVFQLPLLLSCFSSTIYFMSFIVYSMRKALLMVQKVHRNRNPDGTFASSQEEPVKRRGRPSKSR